MRTPAHDDRAVVLRTARTHPDAPLTHIAARTGCATADVWRYLHGGSGWQRPYLRRVAMQRSGSPAGVVTRSARDNDIGVRTLAACQRLTPAAVAVRLSGDPEPAVRAAAAGHQAATPPQIGRLTGDSSSAVRAAAAASPACPPSLLARLAVRDPAAAVRYAAGRNSRCPIRDRLTRHPAVRDGALAGGG